MVLSQQLLSHRQSLSVEGFSFGITALGLVELRQIIQTGCDSGMVLSQQLLSHRQSLSVERFSFGVAALVIIEIRQII